MKDNIIAYIRGHWHTLYINIIYIYYKYIFHILNILVYFMLFSIFSYIIKSFIRVNINYSNICTMYAVYDTVLFSIFELNIVEKKTII